MSRSAPSQASRASKGSKASSKPSRGQASEIGRALDFFHPSGSVEANPPTASRDAEEGADEDEEEAKTGNPSSQDAVAPADTREEKARMTRAAMAYLEFERKWKEKQEKELAKKLVPRRPAFRPSGGSELRGEGSSRRSAKYTPVVTKWEST